MQLDIIIDDSYPSSSLVFPLIYDEDGYPWEGTPYIALNEQQLRFLAARFDISLAEAKEVIIAHELGHYSLFLKGEDYTNEVRAWEHAPQTSLPIEVVQEIKEYCLRTYSIS